MSAVQYSGKCVFKYDLSAPWSLTPLPCRCLKKYGDPDQYLLLQQDYRRMDENPDIRKVFRRDGYTSDESVREYILKWEQS